MLDPKAKEPLADEFERLVREYREPYPESTQQEAWNLIADFAIENADVIARRLSTVTPAEAGGLVERLRAFAAGCRGSMWQSREETIHLCDEAATALEAKEAELVGALGASERFSVAWRDAERRAERAEAALAEARKALEEIAVVCTESASACRKRMGTRVGNALAIARRALTGGQEDG